jgi:hypothetical protein
MGFWSYTCAKTHLPILASTSWGWDEGYSKVTMLDADNNRVSGSYDGYGRIHSSDGGETELDDDAILSGRAKLVLSKFYKGEKFEELGRNSSDPGQGHFHNEDDIEVWYAQGGFPSHKDMIRAYHKMDAEKDALARQGAFKKSPWA